MWPHPGLEGGSTTHWGWGQALDACGPPQPEDRWGGGGVPGYQSCSLLLKNLPAWLQDKPLSSLFQLKDSPEGPRRDATSLLH